jgi:general secretion pathway protein B
MSYILDALKKAERDRGLAKIPTVMTVHELRDARRSRFWIVAAGTFACAAAAILYFLLYPGTRVQPPGPSPVIAEQVNQPRAPERQMEPPPKPVESVRKERLQRPRAVVAEEMEEKVVAPVPPAASAAAPASVPPSNAAAQPASLDEAAKKMSISILVYEENKADRLVFINGTRYVEGDLVDGTYLLKSITPDGVILSHGREEVFLRPGSR